MPRQALVLKPWQEARPGGQVELLPQDGEMYSFAQSHDRMAKERAMRKRQLERLWARLAKLSTMRLSREAVLMKLGAAQRNGIGGDLVETNPLYDGPGQITALLAATVIQEILSLMAVTRER